MTYTLWSRGRLLGESKLDYARCVPGYRMGSFYPSDIGERLMPMLVGVSPAMIALYSTMRNQETAAPTQTTPANEPPLADAMRSTTEYADCVSAQDSLASLDLVVRDANGCVIASDWIAMQDTEFLLSLARTDALALEEDSALIVEEFSVSDNADDREDIEDDGFDGLYDTDDESWQPSSFPRYQLAVMLGDARSIP